MDANVEADPVDAETYEAMRRLLGEERAVVLVGRLAEQIDRRLGVEALIAGTRDALGRDAHGLVSSAGVLGFHELARLCGELEHACLAGPVPGALLARVDAASTRALTAIKCLRAGVTPVPG